MARRPTQRQLFRELAAKFGPEVALAFRSAVDDLKTGVELQRLRLAIARGDLAGAIEALHIDRAAFAGLEAKLVEAYAAGGAGAVATMPSAVSVGFRFDPGNQRAATWIRSFAANLITGLVETERQQARAIIAEGMATGRTPQNVALDLVGRLSRATGKREGGMIGLSGPQREYVRAAYAELTSGDPAQLKAYLGRKRRVKYPFDRTVITAIRTGQRIPPATARTIADRYAASLLKLRGEVIARTEGLPAIRAAKREAYQQLVDDGRVDAQTIVRAWHTIKDGRERETHGAMDGQEVQGLDQPFQSPSGALLRYPGDASLGAGTAEIVSCRCDESISIRTR